MNILNECIYHLKQKIVGLDKVIELVLCSLFTEGHILLEGPPGVGKTFLSKNIAKILDLNFSRIQFTSDLMPSDITGNYIIVETESGKKRFEFLKGPIFANIILADEINRATPRTQSALLQAMAEKQITIRNITYNLGCPFCVIATQNPFDMEGTYPLPESQLDRFSYKVNIEFYPLDEFIRIIKKEVSQGENITPILHHEEILKIIAKINSVIICEDLIEKVCKIVSSTCPESPLSPDIVKSYVKTGAGVRAAQAIIKGAKFYAYLNNREYVRKEDILKYIEPAIIHRIHLNFRARSEGISEKDIIQHILQLMEVI